jgi:hypothetical protein
MPERAMRKAEWRDIEGRRWVALLPPDMPDSMAHMGLQYGPASLESLGLPLKYEVMLHNELVSRDLLTVADVTKNPEAVQSAVRGLIKAGAREIIDCFIEATTG